MTLKNILTQNGKLTKTSKATGLRCFNFSIPAYKSLSGKVTCPFAKDCVKYCYAQKSFYKIPRNMQYQEERYELTKRSDFVDIMIQEIISKRADVIRIHDAGDFYNVRYIHKWFEIANELPEVRFYAYTKSISLFKLDTIKDIIPENMDIIFSEGSKTDSLIDFDRDRHARIFKKHEDLVSAGYISSMDNDLLATKWYTDNNKIGLVFH